MAEPLRRRRPLLHPSRWPILIGGPLVVVGSFLPWQTVTWPLGAPEVTSGASSFDAPGLQLILLFALTLALAALPSVAGSRTRLVQLLPAIAGIAAGVIAIGAYQKLANAGGPAGPSSYSVEGGFWLAALGSGLVALGGVATSTVISRDRPLRPEEDADPGAVLLIVPPLIALVAGLIIGVAVAVAVSPALGPGGSIVAPLLMLIATVVAALVVHTALKAIWPWQADGAGREKPSRGDLPDLEPVQRQDRRP